MKEFKKMKNWTKGWNNRWWNIKKRMVILPKERKIKKMKQRNNGRYKKKKKKEKEIKERNEERQNKNERIKVK